MSDQRAARLMWVGVWAGPVAWALQHAAGVMFGLAQCNPNGQRWEIPLRTWDVLIAIVTGLVAVAGIVAAILEIGRASCRERV